MRGRKPKPTIVKQREGNAGKRPLSANVVLINDGVPEPPSFLSKEGKAHFVELVDRAMRMGTYSASSVNGIIMGAYTWSEWKRAVVRLEREGLVLTAKNGVKQPNPVATRARQLQSDYMKFCASYGLTPVDATRLKVDGRQGVDGYGADADFGEGIV